MFESLWRRFPVVLMARRNLTRARTRSALAIAAIVIGVVAIATLGIAGVAFKDAQFETLGSIGSDLQVFAGEDDDDGYLTDADLRQMERATGDAELVPMKQRNANLAVGRSDGSVTVYGVADPDELYTVRDGAIPGNWRRGALVGATLADRYGLEPGNKLELDGETYRVAAVLEDEGQAAVASPNEAVVLPRATFDSEGYAQVVVRSDDVEAANESAMAIRDAFNGREQQVSVFERGEVSEQIDQAFAQVNLFLVGLGAISLVVAGVSIANVMLMSAIERREEIGVLRAVGYERGDVLRIMLTEATLLGVVGALLGVLVSLGLGLVINDALLGDPLAFTAEGLRYALSGFVFGVAASALGGLYPAWKASRQRPVDALRG
ncbi:ABC transporter permease [Haloprofundus halophilus]|uniref:ABC transporter permease n=1 Tax=Haloprofundus halophilus TaxID=2283527 RepID=UPI000E447CE8|nr:ABC transporter permease [Haloprofundus halophilus]